MPEPANPDTVVEDGQDLDEADPQLQAELDFHGTLAPLDLGFTLRVESDHANFVVFTDAAFEGRHLAYWLRETYPKTVAIGLALTLISRAITLYFPAAGTLFLVGSLLRWWRNPLSAIIPVDPTDVVDWAIAGAIPHGNYVEDQPDQHPGITFIAY